jgi:hypothetical protein
MFSKALFSAALLTVGALAVACSDTAGTSSGGGGGGGAACKPAPGTYTYKLTRTAGDAAKCPETTSEITLKDDNGDGGGTATPDPDCTETKNEATCEASAKCTKKQGTFTTTTETTQKSSTTGGSGTTSTKTVDDKGMVLSECSYSYTITKK